MEIKLSVIGGTLQLTARSKQALPDQARNHAKPCEIKQNYNVLQSDDAENLTINLRKHDFQPTLINPMENELFSDCGDLTINRTQWTNATGPDQLPCKSVQHVVLPGSPWSQSTPHWKRQNPIFSCPSKPRN